MAHHHVLREGVVEHAETGADYRFAFAGDVPGDAGAGYAPAELGPVLPTRLGNTLRAAESYRFVELSRSHPTTDFTWRAVRPGASQPQPSRASPA